MFTVTAGTRFGQLRRLERKLGDGTKRKSRYWYCRTLQDRTGKSTWATTRRESKREAEQVVEGWKREQQELERRKLLGLPDDPTEVEPPKGFLLALDEWLARKKPQVCPKHYRVTKGRADLFWRPFFRDRPLESISLDDIEEYKIRRGRGTLPGQTLPRAVAAETVRGDLRQLRNFFNEAHKRGELRMNPCDGLKAIRGKRRARVYHLSIDEEESLLRACTDVPPPKMVTAMRGGKRTNFQKQQTSPPSSLRPFVILALYSGFRKRTLLDLRWCDINLEAGEWCIPAESFKDADEDYQRPTHPRVVEELLRYRQELVSECKCMGLSVTKRLAPTSKVFGLDNGDSIRWAFRVAVRRSGLDKKNFTLHDARRVLINRLIEAGAELHEVMALSGHRDSKILSKYYAKPRDSSLRERLQKIGRTLAESEAARG